MHKRVVDYLSILLLFGPLFIFSFSTGHPARAATSNYPALDLAYYYISGGFFELGSMTLSKNLESSVPAEGIDEEHVEILLVFAMTKDALGEWDEAKELYTRIIRSPDIDESYKDVAYALLGNLELEAGRSKQAEEFLSKADERLPEHAFILYSLGRLAESVEEIDAAAHHYEKASELSADWLSPILRAATIHNQQGAYNEAVRLLLGAEFLGTRDVDFHLELTRALKGIWHHLELDPSFVIDDTLHERLGLDESDRRPALLRLMHHALDRALQLSPQHPEALTLLQGIPPIP